MTYAPTSILDLRAYLAPRTGLSPVSLGIVGDARHTKGYHLGRDRIFSASGQGDDDYSVKVARDRLGLSSAASALDIGNWSGLRALSIWLVSACRSNVEGTKDIREVIYSPDGRTVLRYDRQRGIDSPPKTGEADNSHLFHTHVSWYRDSEARDKIALFRRYFDVISEDDMLSFPVPDSPSVAVIKSGAWLYRSSDLLADPGNVRLSAERRLPYIGKVNASSDIRIVAYDTRPDLVGTAHALFVKPADVVRIERVAEDCAAEIAAATAEIRERLADVTSARDSYARRIQAIRAKVAEVSADIADD